MVTLALLLFVLLVRLLELEPVEMFGIGMNRMEVTLGRRMGSGMGMMLTRSQHNRWLNAAGFSTGPPSQQVYGSSSSSSSSGVEAEAKKMEVHKAHMFLALRHAQFGLRDKEVPIGAVIVDDKGEVIAASRNQVEKTNDISMHAEIDCIRKAASVLQSWRLNGCTLYTTLEPCPMCMGAILSSRIKTLVYAAGDSNVGSCGSMVDINQAFPFHKVEIIKNVLGEESSTLLKRFFQSRRAENDANRSGDGANVPKNRFAFDDRGKGVL